LTFATLPHLSIEYYYFDPQKDIPIGEDGFISSQTIFNGLQSQYNAGGGRTTYIWYYENGNIVSSNMIIEINGKFTFDESLNGERIYCEMRNTAFVGLKLRTSVAEVITDVENNVSLEVIAKQLIYGNHSVGEKIGQYTVSQIFTNSLGLYAAGLTRTVNGTQRSVLVFRGTSDTFDVLSDLNPNGVGYNQYYNVTTRQQILQWANNAAANGTFTVTGHSLGGTLAQWFAADFVSQGGTLDSVLTYNATGISKEAAGLFNNRAGNCQVVHHITSGDVVSMFGEAFINGTAYIHKIDHFNPSMKHTALFSELENYNNYSVGIIGTNDLNDDWFHYEDAYYAGLLATASVTPAPQLFFRKTAEEARQNSGNTIKNIVNLTNLLNEKGTFTIPDIEFPNGWGLKGTTINYDTVAKTINAKTKIQFPKSGILDAPSLEVGIEFVNNRINKLSASATDMNQLLVKVRNVPIYLQKIGVTVDNIETGDFRIGGTIGFSVGPTIKIKNKLFDFEGTPLAFEGGITAGKDYAKLNGKLSLAGSLLSVSGELGYNWNNGTIKNQEGKVNLNVLNGLIEAEGKIAYRYGEEVPTLYASASGAINIPKQAVFGTWGGMNLAKGSMEMFYTENNNNSDDYVAVKTNILGKKLEFKIYSGNDPVSDFVVNGIRKINLDLFKGAATQKSLSTQSFVTAKAESAEDYLLMLNWDNAAPGATGTITLSNGTKLTEAQMLASGKFEFVTELCSETTRTYLVNSYSVSEIAAWKYEIDGVTGTITPSLYSFVEPMEVVTKSITSGNNDQQFIFDVDIPNGTPDTKLTFFLDQNNGDFNGEPVYSTTLGELKNNGWTPENIPAGTYYVYVRAEGGDYVSETVYFKNPITITGLPGTVSDFDLIRSQYADLNLSANKNDYNIIEIAASQLSDENIRKAIAQAAATTANDLIILHTTETQNKITLSGTELTIDINAVTYGSITIVSLGTNTLTVDANQLSRVFNIKTNTDVGLAGLIITNGKATGDSTNSYGAGINNWGTSIVTNCILSGNTASYDGGGIMNGYGKLTVINSTVSGNTASSYGGGIFNIGANSILTVTNSRVSENIAYSGGGIYNESSGKLNVTNCTIAANTASYHGGGIFNTKSGTTTLYNTIIAQNSSEDIYQNLATTQGSNNLTGFTNWNGVIGTNYQYDSSLPLFIDAKNGDYRLANNSQAINKGNNSYISGIAKDLAGNNRINNCYVDIGAYEYYPNQITLQPPANLRYVAVAQTTIFLDWNNVNGATGYILQRKNSSGIFETIYAGTESRFVDSQLTANTQYEYRVTATGNEGNSGYTALTAKTAAKTDNNGKVIVDTPMFVMEPVYNNIGNSVTLEWTNLGNEYTYVLYKAGRVVVNFGNDNSYIDTNPSASGVEGYALMAYHKATQQLSSVTMSVVHTTAKPVEITGYEVSSDGKIKLLWEAEPGVSYNIFRAGKNISGNLTFNNDNIGSWTDNNPLVNNDYMLVAVYQDGQTYRATFSNIYNLKKPLQSQSANAALNAFWSNYDLDLIDDVLAATI
jgi:hypothetical protein